MSIKFQNTDSSFLDDGVNTLTLSLLLNAAIKHEQNARRSYLSSEKVNISRWIGEEY